MLLVADRPHDLSGGADHEHAVGNFHARCDDGAGGNQAFFADVSVAEEHGTHADQRAAADAFAMDNGAVSDRDVIFDRVGEAGVAVDDAPSWMLTRSPIVTGATSPRMTAPNQTLVLAPSFTSPVTVEL